MSSPADAFERRLAKIRRRRRYRRPFRALVAHIWAEIATDDAVDIDEEILRAIELTTKSATDAVTSGMVTGGQQSTTVEEPDFRSLVQQGRRQVWRLHRRTIMKAVIRAARMHVNNAVTALTAGTRTKKEADVPVADVLDRVLNDLRDGGTNLASGIGQLVLALYAKGPRSRPPKNLLWERICHGWEFLPAMLRRLEKNGYLSEGLQLDVKQMLEEPNGIQKVAGHIDLFQKYWDVIERYEPHKALPWTFLETVLRNHIISFLRMPKSAPPLEPAFEAAIPDPLAKDVIDPDYAARFGKAVEAVCEDLNREKYPAREIIAFRLRHFEGLTLTEIGRILRWNVGAGLRDAILRMEFVVHARLASQFAYEFNHDSILDKALAVKAALHPGVVFTIINGHARRGISAALRSLLREDVLDSFARLALARPEFLVELAVKHPDLDRIVLELAKRYPATLLNLATNRPAFARVFARLGFSKPKGLAKLLFENPDLARIFTFFAKDHPLPMIKLSGKQPALALQLANHCELASIFEELLQARPKRMAILLGEQPKLERVVLRHILRQKGNQQP